MYTRMWSKWMLICLIFSYFSIRSNSYLKPKQIPRINTCQNLFSFFPKKSSTIKDIDVMKLDKEGIMTLQKGSLPSTASITGCWKVEKILPGISPSWTKYSNLLGFLNQNKNSNYQVFFEDGSFYNLSEYLGQSLCATAEGRYECVKMPHPSRLLAYIKRISIRVMGKVIASFSVDGQGVITVLYLSEQLRVLESEEGACVIQSKTEIPNVYKYVKDSMTSTNT
jgi:hypothetical protein